MLPFRRFRLLPLLLVPAALGACAGSRVESAAGHGATAAPLALADVAALEQRFDVQLLPPEFARTPASLEEQVRGTLTRADWELERLVAQPRNTIGFSGSIAALDVILHPVVNVANEISVIKESSTDAAMREKASAMVEVLSAWSIALQYRQDVYGLCRAFEQAYQAGARPELAGEDLKLFEETMRDYRRAGLALEPQTRTEVERLQNELSRIENEFDTNITDAAVTTDFSAAELAGVPQGFLDSSRTASGRHAVRATVITDYLAVMENARKEETRKRLATVRYSVAMAENGPLLRQMTGLRARIAGLLGYATWADYQIEPRMAKSGANAMAFAEDLSRRLEPKFRAEVEALRALKLADAGDPQAKIELWDFRYYQNQLRKERYQVDAEALRRFFELDRVLAGMFGVYEEIFGLRFRQVKPSWVWAKGVTLWLASDAQDGRPLGMFYLDLFPREGKYNHFAQFDVVTGRALEDGSYRRPVAALICNFTPPGADTPSLLSHSEVETFFHEFGHCLHTILTQAKYGRYAGAAVAQDFVEAPSQMLENWVWSPQVLRRFAVDWQNPDETIDLAVVERMAEADLATKAVWYRRQLAFALADLRMHSTRAADDPVQVANQTIAEVFFTPPAGSGFAAYWGHLTGYDAGYYGYAWADSISADLASAFEASPGGLLDVATGMRLRREIYSVGGSRDESASIRAFLGRDTDNRAFAHAIGVD
ncbi:MAG TPA: M3 family metallopeptidase [Planctomycetota bacterium]